MTKKHFAELAAALLCNRPLGNPPGLQASLLEQWSTDCKAIARACRTANPRFDRARFLEACGVEA